MLSENKEQRTIYPHNHKFQYHIKLSHSSLATTPAGGGKGVDSLLIVNWELRIESWKLKIEKYSISNVQYSIIKEGNE